MKQCKYCKENIEDEAKRCKVCGEPFYFWGAVIKFAPVISIVFAAASIWFAMIQYEGKIKAVGREKTAVDENREQEKATLGLLKDLSVSKTEPDALRKIYKIDSNTNLSNLEEKLRKNPNDTKTRQKILIYKSLKTLKPIRR